MSKEETNEYIKEINDKQGEINKLREQLSECMIDNCVLIRSDKNNELKIKQALEYIDYLNQSPTYKSVGEMLQDIRDILWR